jgi:tRNA(Arg) A34 adenosine deaminase TadA
MKQRIPARRRLLQCIAVAASWLVGGIGVLNAQTADRDRARARRWIDAAFEMRRRALSWGDQPYGAVLVLDDRLAGEGPSRVVKNRDPDAHAEREAIRDAQKRLGRGSLAGAVLYSTSRPCSICERAAFEAGVARMIHGEDAQDAGAPRG